MPGSNEIEERLQCAEKAIDRIERENRQERLAIAQLASALRITQNWKPRVNNQTALAEILEEAQTARERAREEVTANA